MLEYALALEASGDFAQAQPFVRAVLAMPDSVLPASDPVRRVAQLHDALILSRSNDAADARASLAKSGLDAGQCSLFDTHPIPASVSIASSRFPAEALRWHFEGYVREAFDITDDGRVANVRTIVAYPPFIFGPSTESAVKSFRYVPPSIDGKAVGCSGETQRVSYRLPG